MPYLTTEQFTDRFDQEELDELLGALDETKAAQKLEAAIADAEALTLSYVTVQYDTVPAAGTALIRRIVGDIARFHLYDDLASQEVKERYELQIKFLKDLAAGKAKLAGSSDEDVSDVAVDSHNVLVGGSATGIDLDGF